MGNAVVIIGGGLAAQVTANGDRLAYGHTMLATGAYFSCRH